MTTAEVAAALGVSLRRVQAMRKDGKFPHAKKVGRDWYIPKRDVENVIIETKYRPRKYSK